MLPRLHRLPAPEIQKVMRYGKRVMSNGMTLIYTTRNTSPITHPSRFAFIVSTKVDKRATVRNRIRRLMSESVRHHLNKITVGIDGAFIGSKSLMGLTQEQVEAIVLDLLQRVGL